MSNHKAIALCKLPTIYIIFRFVDYFLYHLMLYWKAFICVISSMVQRVNKKHSPLRYIPIHKLQYFLIAYSRIYRIVCGQSKLDGWFFLVGNN